MVVHTTGKILLGAVGVTALAASGNTVSILAEAVRRAVVQLSDKVRGIEERAVNPKKASGVDDWHVRDLLPYSRTESWGALGLAALKNVIVGTAALYTIYRFCPSAVTHANALLHKVVPIQFTPNHIPLFKYVGL